MHDRPSAPYDWTPVIRYGGAYGGLAIIGFFCYELVIARHLDPRFKFGALAVIVVIAVVGALAILSRDEPAERTGERLYTAEEVAELLEAMRANGRLPAAPSREPSGAATCIFCHEAGAEVRGLDGSRYHRSCFQRAYREHDEEARLRRR